MSVSERQREANRRNAQKSTGPTSDAGKARAAQNATTHGLTAKLPAVGPEAEQARRERIAVCFAQFRPRTAWEYWLVEELAGVSIKLGRIWEIEARLRTVAAARARTGLWDDDRRVEVETLGSRLARHPAKVLAQLRQSPHGCDWLTERWARLAQLAASSGWDAQQTQLAHHLLGTPTADEGSAVVPIGNPAAVARQQLERLRTARASAVEIDREARALVQAGDNDIPNREIANLRRYEQTTRRYLFWIMAQMSAIGLCAGNGIHPEPAFPAEPQAVPVLAPVPQPAQPHLLAPAPTPVERNEPILSSNDDEEDDETKPLMTDSAASAMPAGSKSPQKRPDLAKIAKRDRKARRKRGQRRHQV